MGLRPVLGRLLTAQDDGREVAGAAVLTHRFWTTSLSSDPTVIGKTIRLGSRTATVIGVLEPSVPYPADTEIIANVVTRPHHLGATDGHQPHAPDDRALRTFRARSLP
jgi:putative ABC transport system permease protein